MNTMLRRLALLMLPFGIALLAFDTATRRSQPRPIVEAQPSELDYNSLNSQQIQEHCAAQLDELQQRLCANERQTVTECYIGHKDDPIGGPATVKVAAVHWIECGCCSSAAHLAFTDEHLRAFAYLPQIGSLTIQRTDISDAGLQMLERHPEITHLDLSQNELTDRALQHIGKLPNLKVLRLSETKLTGAEPEGSLKHLAGLKRLELLDLSKTQLHDEALQHLSALTGLKRLILAETPLTGRGFAKLAALTELKELSLSGSSVGSQLVKLPLLPALTTFSVSNTGFTDSGLRALRPSSVLSELDVGHTQISDQGLSHLRNFANLRSVGVQGTQVTDDGIQHLAEAKQLESLSIYDTHVKGPGIIHLKGCTQLQYLSTGWNRDGALQVTEEMLPVLRSLKGLRSLNLDLSRLDATQDLTLEGFPQLHDLKVFCGSSFGPIRVHDMPRLRWLSILGVAQPTPPSSYGVVSPDVVPKITRITLGNLGEQVSLSTVAAEEMDLTALDVRGIRELTGDVKERHAMALRKFEVARVNALPGSDPAAVAAILSAPGERRYGHLALDHWTKDWSEALGAVACEAMHRFTMTLPRVDTDAPIELPGFSMLRSLTLKETSADHVVVTNLSPWTFNFNLQEAAVGTLEFQGCCPSLACEKVRRLDRLVVRVAPATKVRLHIFDGSNGHFGRTPEYVAAPEVLELHGLDHVRSCILNHGHGVERIEVHGPAENFVAFDFVPKTVKSMTWQGRQPGRWQGEFYRRLREQRNRWQAN